jgi:hypothetical protein
MSLYQFTSSAILTVFSDNSGMALYNGYDGDTVFLNAGQQSATDLPLAELPPVFSASELAAALAIIPEEAAQVVQYLLQRKLIAVTDNRCK